MFNSITLFLILFGQVNADLPLPETISSAPDGVATGEDANSALAIPEEPVLEAPAIEGSAPAQAPVDAPVPDEPRFDSLAAPKPVPHKNPRMIPPPFKVSRKSMSFSAPTIAADVDANDPALVNLSALDAPPAPSVAPSPYSTGYAANNDPSMGIEDSALQSPTASSFDDDSMYDVQLNPNQGKGHVMPIDQAEVPAQEQGVLVKFHVREGMIVEKDAPIAQIDDEQAKMSVEVQQAKLNAAEKEASNDVNIRYAKAARNVADAELKSAKETIARVPGAVPATEIRKLELSLIQATLQIEQASNQFEISKYQVDVSRAELNAAKLGLSRRVVTSPISGVIVEKYRNEGEWVKPGDPIVKIVYLDKLRVKTTMDINKMPLQKVMNHTASITVVQQPGMSFKGKVVFANPVVQSGGAYEVWIDVDNVLGKDNFWALQPGMNAVVTIE